jgi:hypothetical protein
MPVGQNNVLQAFPFGSVVVQFEFFVLFKPFRSVISKGVNEPALSSAGE